MSIVVIDDEPPVRRLLSEVLRNAGHRVLETSSPRQGLEWLDSERVDLLLADIGMPSVSGWEVARRARELQPELLIGVVSGWESHVSKRDLAARGVDFFWTKPFDVKKILAVLQEL